MGGGPPPSWRHEEWGATGNGALPRGKRGCLRCSLALGVIFFVVVVAAPFFAVPAVAFGRCPAPSCSHHYCLVDCQFVRAADATSSVSYSSSSSLRPHFVAIAIAAVAFGCCPTPSHRHCVIIYLLIVGLFLLPMPRHWRHILRYRRCGPICCRCRSR